MGNNKSKHSGILKITPITPIHISAGENYQRFEYFIDTKGNFYLKDLMKFFLDNADDFDSAVKIMKDLSFRPPDEYIRYTLPVYANTKDITTTSGGRGQTLEKISTPQSLARGGKLDPEIAKIMKQAQTQPKQAPPKTPPNQEPILQPTEQILSFIKDPFNQPFIPGSSLKGCLRTAITYALLKNTELQSNSILEVIISKAFQKQKEFDEKERNKAIRKGQNYKPKPADKLQDNSLLPHIIPANDAKYDLFKALVIRDSQPFKLQLINLDEDGYLTIPNFGICQIRIVKKIAKRIREQEGIILAESLLPILEKPIEIPFYIDMFILERIIQVAEEDLNEKGKKQRVEEELNFLLSNKSIFETLRTILSTPDKFTQALTDFSKELVKTQVDFFENSTYKDALNRILQPYINNNCILLQIGFGTGYLSKTIALAYDVQSRLRIQQNLHLGEHEYDEDSPFPRSRRVITSKDNLLPSLPMGWFKLDIEWK
ncbi:MAG: type III-A CRISPR-associated RAMP protein Csm5 [Candidatus Hydrogenedentes bacterium]|nr:type III-A CRISPR-associated RAMP protein Csm5 [Candidatus Hydrogenedentota bacterium]